MISLLLSLALLAQSPPAQLDYVAELLSAYSLAQMTSHPIFITYPFPNIAI